MRVFHSYQLCRPDLQLLRNRDGKKLEKKRKNLFSCIKNIKFIKPQIQKNYITACHFFLIYYKKKSLNRQAKNLMDIEVNIRMNLIPMIELIATKIQFTQN